VKARIPEQQASGCPPWRGAAETWLQEQWRKRRQHQRCGTISCMIAMAIARVAGDVEPMEVDPPEGEEKPVEMDSPPAWLTWQYYTMPGLPSMMPWQQCHRGSPPTLCHRPDLHLWR